MPPSTEPFTERAAAIAKIHPEEQLIVDRIYSAVMERRLAPRTKLSEAALCETFGVGRMRVRRALLLLGSQGIVDLQSNKGAYVSCPSADDAREVFEARLLVETGIVRKLASEISPPAVDVLSRHITLEDEARQRQARTDIIRLSGEFHVQLAKANGNTLLARVVRELVTRTSLIVGLFGTNRKITCPEDEHCQIVAAIVDGNADLAAQRIRHHLEHIENGLELDRSRRPDTDIARILGGG
ncbi:GntR family transcriptional regulator [Roseibium salinum]|uniref:GntR family transcriptional regulator n=1 Tax=Roseibium salinum TaxID=1604349 RepID=A0ABT3QVY7_9HYPH|nr:GntR family transcriptional regulator [Roseibium sp. DSM 29163]MCX2721089.1 GntR family transcriptional regulator [Roseibium sp. DSM 29163]